MQSVTLEAVLADPNYAFLMIFVCFGATCTVGLSVMIPLMINVLLGVWSSVFGEQALRGANSGVITPEILDRDFVDPGDVKPVGG